MFSDFIVVLATRKVVQHEWRNSELAKFPRPNFRLAYVGILARYCILFSFQGGRYQLKKRLSFCSGFQMILEKATSRVNLQTVRMKLCPRWLRSRKVTQMTTRLISHPQAQEKGGDHRTSGRSPKKGKDAREVLSQSNRITLTAEMLPRKEPLCGLQLFQFSTIALWVAWNRSIQASCPHLVHHPSHSACTSMMMYLKWSCLKQTAMPGRRLEEGGTI